MSIKSTYRKTLYPCGVNRPDLPMDVIAELYLSGVGSKAIADSFGTTPPTIRNKLIAHGVAIRNVTEANRRLALERTVDERRLYTKKARTTRLGNLREASVSGIERYDVGTGYHCVSDALAKAGFVLQHQVLFKTYYVDLVFDGVAVEVEYSPALQFTVHTERFKYFLKRNQFIVYVMLESVAALEKYLKNVVAVLDQLRRFPPSGREYGVIRCHAKRGFAYLQEDKRTAVARPKKAYHPIDWTH